MLSDKLPLMTSLSGSVALWVIEVAGLKRKKNVWKNKTDTSCLFMTICP